MNRSFIWETLPVVHMDLRPPEEVKRFTWQMTQFLLEKEIKMLVIACNTATAVVLDEISAGTFHPCSWRYSPRCTRCD